jgi:predicted nucleic acid-binding protein
MNSSAALVLDASVVAKWYLLDEELQVEALSIHGAFDRGDISLVMPDIARYEVANTLTVAWRRGRLEEHEMQRALSDFLAWDFTFVGTDDLILSAVDAARRFRCALYDALYLTLAETLGCDLVTADRVLLERAHPAAAWVKWLGDYAAG